MSLLESMREFFLAHGWERTYWIAYSGGLDSHVLLAICAELRAIVPVKLRAIHINHQLSPNAAVWSQHCEQICQQYRIDFIKRDVVIDLAAGESLEEVAREKRYAIFAECLADGDILLTAHQQDDQAETVLLQLLRGAGIKGLAAMPNTKVFARGWHARPLLSFSRTQLQEYAQLHKLAWIEDESNANLQLTRNFLRQDILPLLKKRWPSVAKTISRSAEHCAEAQTLLEEFSCEIMATLKGESEGTLSVSKLLALSADRQRLVLRTWIHQQGVTLPNQKKIESIRNNILTAAWDSMPCVRFGNVEMRRYRDEIYLLQDSGTHAVAEKYTWNLRQTLFIPRVGVLQAKDILNTGLRANIDCVQVGFRQGGEIVNLPKRGHHALKNLFQEWGVPPWLRERIPLIFVEQKCIAAVGYFIDPDYMAMPGENGWELRLESVGISTNG